jgi:sugar diacid utilization regulator
MGKHVPLPSDPTAKAAEKKRRFKLYQKAWKKRRRESDIRERIVNAKNRRELEQAARRAHIDLCVSSVSDMTTKQLKAALQFVQDL